MPEQVTITQSAWDSIGSDAPSTPLASPRTDSSGDTGASPPVSKAPVLNPDRGVDADKGLVKQDEVDSDAVAANKRANKDDKTFKLPPPKPETKLDSSKLKALRDGDDFKIDVIKEQEAKAKEDKKEGDLEIKTDSTPAAKQSKSERDFTGLELNDAEKKLWQNMSLPAFEHAKAQIINTRKELTESRAKLKAAEESIATAGKKEPNGLPSNYYEHEHAYVLSSEYQQSVQKQQQFDGELKFWDAQYAAVRAGEKWIDLVQQPDGSFKAVEMDPSANAETLISRRINNLDRLANEEKGKTTQIAKEFGTKISERNNLIRFREDQVFPKFKENAELHKTDPAYQSMFGALKEAGLETNPLSGTLAKYHHYHMELLTKYNNLLRETQAKEKNVTERAQAGPSSSEINRGSNGRAKEEPAKLSNLKIRNLIHGD